MNAAKQILDERNRVYAAKDQTSIKAANISESAQKDIKEVMQKKITQGEI